ncbi:flavodoxin [Oceanimonas sp. MB9]|uniref:flavodoxin n=1 Tax=Oceanimonas sp. MB9 TaxID=2588453 RepID=UPI0013F5F1ED|nr:flavodoxin [Oceanimonas sp. MB9]NHI00306.1 Sulfite reductase [NADPH] flavoprotein alpha-component [Oceanimonas sp. MB9]
MATVDIIIGTVYGSAVLVAETLEEELVKAGHGVTLHEDAELADLDPSHFWLFVTSTTGQGDIPPNLVPLFETLREACPPIPAVRYALVALGDSSYEDFCGAGKKLDEQLQELQAQAVTDRLLVDATETLEPEVPALDWLKGWMDRI